MSSDKSVNSNHTVPPVKIKVEPGTSMPVPIKSIKTEPGLPSSTTRLTSFRLPRDLTLGGNNKTEKPKKVYTPNLNAQRNKKKDDATGAKSDGPRNTRDKERGRGRGRGDRGRGRGSNNFVQSTGVWSEGIMNMPAGSRRSGGSRESSDRNPQATLEKPKLDLNRTIDKAEEEEKLKSLLRDDFIDNGEHVDLDNAPVMLPMIEDAKLYKEEPKTEVESDEEVDKKPIILENGEVLKPKKEQKIKIPGSGTDKKEILPSTIPQIMENKTNSYILLQFPDCLPGLECDNDDTRPSRPGEPNQGKENEKKSKTEYCTLNSLKPGMLGKLQILQSGKARLLLGDNNLIVDLGSHLSFRQDLIAAKVDPANLEGDLVNLGQVNSTLICSPDWESMLARL